MTELIYDWNPSPAYSKEYELCDETLRDGLQSPSVQEPGLEQQCQILTYMHQLGIAAADIGLPGAGPRAAENTLNLARYIAQHQLSIQPYCAARTLEVDIQPISDIQQKSGLAITAYCFLGTSPIRQAVEDWNLDKLLKTCETSIQFAHKQNLEVAFVTEDTTRSHPDTLRVLFKQAISMGCKRLVLCDTVGHSTPEGTAHLIRWTRQLVGPHIALDWHGHNDRGFGLINSLTALQAGCTRIHGTCLGIGERVGNTPMDQLILNLKLMGLYTQDARVLGNYVKLVSQACQVPIPYNYPVFGQDAFRTATGVHAAAIIKAQQKAEPNWADIVYSAVPANQFGQKQKIEIGPMSGLSNIRYWLSEQSIQATEEQVLKIFDKAKNSKHILNNSEIKQCLSISPN